MKIYIYGLYDPVEPQIIRYVGATADLLRRVNEHIKGRDRTTKPLHAELAALGRPIAFRVLQETDELNKASVEADWIEKSINPKLLNEHIANSFEFRVSPIITMADMQLRYLNWTLDHFGGNKLATCRALGIGRQTLYNMLRKSST